MIFLTELDQFNREPIRYMVQKSYMLNSLILSLWGGGGDGNSLQGTTGEEIVIVNKIRVEFFVIFRKRPKRVGVH